jgi:hypothetical protein
MGACDDPGVEGATSGGVADGTLGRASREIFFGEARRFMGSAAAGAASSHLSERGPWLYVAGLATGGVVSRTPLTSFAVLTLVLSLAGPEVNPL